MSASAHKSRLGWLLVWAVVFCDIGTSVYYVPGILYHTNGDLAGVFVVLTLLAFVLLCWKYLEITRRFREGGGVVTVAETALGPWWGCVGGQLIMVDYFLTAAISATSGLHYIDSILHLHGLVVPLSFVALGVLAVLNVVGIKESAGVSLVLAAAALVVDAAVIGTALFHEPRAFVEHVSAQFEAVPGLTFKQTLFGFSGAWLAFSGLESISQLSPAMEDTGKTPARGMLAVAASVILTAPLLTFLATSTLPAKLKGEESERFISELAAVWGGFGLKLAVVLTASVLLLFAANTAIIGNYHVQIALGRSGFLPRWIGELSRRFGTPVRAIVLSVIVPIVVIAAVNGDVNALGDLYAFGLLGAFMLTSASLDLLHWRENKRGVGFYVGLVTTLLVSIAFATNLVAKPKATIFGSVVTAIGLVVAVAHRRNWFGQLFERVATEPEIVHAREQVPYRLPEEAAANPPSPRPAIMVATRGASEAVFAEAAARATSRGEKQVWVIYVDEIPGLFYPDVLEPSPEGLTVLRAARDELEKRGIQALPLWGWSKVAAESVGEAAKLLGTELIVIGFSQRGMLWTALRGRFVTQLLAALPATVRVVAVG